MYFIKYKFNFNRRFYVVMNLKVSELRRNR